MLTQSLSGFDRLIEYRRPIYILARTLAIVFAGLFILEHGDWSHTEEFRGPFERSPGEILQYRVAIGTDVPFLSIPSPRPPSERSPGENSPVRVWVNGKSWNPPEAPEPLIEQGRVLGIKGLYRTLQFTLPTSIANDASTTLKVEYQIRAQRTPYEIIALGAMTMIVLGLCVAYRSGDCKWISAFCAHATAPWLLAMHMSSWILVVACAAYIGTIAYGFTIGAALPTATVFHLIPEARFVSGLAAFIPLGVIAFAAFGAAFAWLAWLDLAPAEPIRKLESAQRRIWKIFGLPVLLGLFLFALSAGGWSGYVHTTDNNYMSLAGLVPHSDSSAFFKDTFHLAYFGDWELMGTRRPMAEALREITVVAANYSYKWTLIIQLTLMVVTLFLASHLLAGWYGIWSGLGFAGFAFSIARPFLSTTLTEPLGYIFGLFALMFFVQSFRQQSARHALIGLAALTIALLMRMGALFAVPFMVLWIGYAFAKDWLSRMRLVGWSCVVIIAVVFANFLLQGLYGATGVDTGGNFAWTTCGLSVGMSWDGCDKLYPTTLASLPSERAQSMFLFTQTWLNFTAHPQVLLGAMWDNFSNFMRGIGPFMLAGYIPLYSATSVDSYLLLLPPAVAIWFVWRKVSATERSFWIAMLASLPLSAGIVMMADGWRLLHVTHLFVAAFLALGFAVPLVEPGQRDVPRLNWQIGAGVLAASLGVFLLFPYLARSWALAELRTHPPI